MRILLGFGSEKQLQPEDKTLRRKLGFREQPSPRDRELMHRIFSEPGNPPLSHTGVQEHLWRPGYQSPELLALMVMMWLLTL